MELKFAYQYWSDISFVFSNEWITRTTKAGKPQRTLDKIIYNLNKNTPDTAGFQLCVLVCLVFLRAKEIWATKVRQRDVYAAIIPVFTTHSHGGVCVDASAGSAAATAASIIHPACFPLETFWRSHNKRGSNNHWEQRQPNPRKPYCCGSSARSVFLLPPSLFFSQTGPRLPFSPPSSWGNANGSAGEGQDN